MASGLVDVVLTAAGLAVVLAGAWLLVQAASRLAVGFGLSPVIVGATIVAFGTSAPEFVVSLVAGLQGSGGLAVGNALGSNVTNVALVVGLAAVISPMAVPPQLLRWELPVLGAATAAVALFGLGGSIGHIEGAVLFASLLAFVVLSLRLHQGASIPLVGEDLEATSGALGRGAIIRESAFVLIGIAALAAGSEMSVRGAVGIAERVGINEIAIGVTIVAVGTSLPEVVTTAVAALRGEQEIAVANVVGSNIFNLLGVLGLSGAIATLPTGGDLYRFEMPALIVSTAVLFLLAWPRGRIGRVEGGALLLAYAAFLAIVLARGGT